jgi:aspartyl-tRNA(Asn)/glutamyl-tRNA(Gln) amidotransferase subunit A
MNDTAIYADLSQLGRWLRSGAVSSVELTGYFLDRLERIGPRLNALAESTRPLAEDQAREADRLLRSGHDLGPLHGIPYAVKDLLATRNIPTRFGAPPFANNVPDHDATVVRRLRAAGAVLVGKLALIELAGAGRFGSASASINGPGLNPWNRGSWSGGSSSGSASAVAAGLTPFALGTETRGSIMQPAAFCGITGFRPSYGAVSRAGVMEACWSIDKVGPMARTARDCAVVFAVISGEDTDDPTTLGYPARRRLRLARTAGVLPLNATCEPEIRDAFAGALQMLREIGMSVIEVGLPGRDYVALSQTLIEGEVAGALEPFIRSPDLGSLLDDDQRRGLQRYLERPLGEFARAVRERVDAIQEIRALFETVDVLVAPSYLTEAPDVGSRLLEIPELQGFPSILGAVAGVPGITVPMGTGRRGLPIGLSITGDLNEDRTVLGTAVAFQRRTAWHRARPDLQGVLS